MSKKPPKKSILSADMSEDNWKESQKEKKSRISTEIQNSQVWSPAANWEFDFSETPRDRNLDDRVVGLLELARERGDLLKKDVKQLSLVYTEAGITRTKRKGGGRSFRDPDGKHVLLATNISTETSR